MKNNASGRMESGLERLYQLIKNLYGGAQKTLLRQGRALWPPISIIFITTHRCNHRCKMCFIQTHGFPEQQHPKEMATDDIFNILDQIPRASLCTFSGGEPLLRRDILQVLTRAAQTNKFHVITNGLLLKEKNAETLLRLGAKSVFHKGLVLVGVSLMGNETLHDEICNVAGSYSLVVDNVRRFQAMKRARGQKFPKIDLKIVISNSNAGEFSLIGDAMEAIRPDYITMQVESNVQSPCYYTQPLDGTEADELEPRLHEYPQPVNIENLDAVIGQIGLMQGHADRLGVKVRTYPSAPVDELVRHFRSEIDLKHYGCISPWTDLFINPYGQALSCLCFGYADLRNVSLRQAWNAPFFTELRSLMVKNGVFRACRGCCFLQYRPHHVI